MFLWVYRQNHELTLKTCHIVPEIDLITKFVCKHNIAY